jgi:hypothetical protein
MGSSSRIQINGVLVNLEYAPEKSGLKPACTLSQIEASFG